MQQIIAKLKANFAVKNIDLDLSSTNANEITRQSSKVLSKKSNKTDKNKAWKNLNSIANKMLS